MDDDTIKKWKFVSDFDNFYEISNFGDIRSVDRYISDSHGRTYMLNGKNLKTHNDSQGYECVKLFKHGKGYGFRIHRLVAIAFIDNSYGLPEVNHIDHNKKNNYFSNLEWCNHIGNIRKSFEFYGLDYHSNSNNPNSKKISIFDNKNNIVYNFSYIGECVEYLIENFNINKSKQAIRKDIYQSIKKNEQYMGYYFKYS